MAYNENSGLVDLFGGREDLSAGLIRCVGCAKERFSEDALRILRAVRFSAQLGFSIEEKTKEGIRELSGNLSLISAERIREELSKLLISQNPDFIRQAYDLGITAVVLPEWDAIMDLEQNNPFHCYTVGEHTLVMLKEVKPTVVQRFAALFHDMGKTVTKTVDSQGYDHFYGHGAASAKIACRIMKRLKFDNDTLHKVAVLIEYHDYPFQMTGESVRRVLSKVGPELFLDLLDLMYGDSAAKAPGCRQMYFDGIETVRELYEEILRAHDCISLKELAVDGRDLIKAGVAPGKKMGELLRKFLDIVIEEPEKNTREYLLGLLENQEGD